MDRPYVNIHTHRPTGEGIELTDTVGIHPWQVGQLDEVGLELALRSVEEGCARTIGEIGLDFAPSVPADHGVQKTIFAAQLRIAEERQLPVVLHCVRAFEPTMEILAAYRLPAVIFHGFIGSRGQALRAVNSAYRLSFGNRAFSSPKTVEAMRELPLESMFLETDDGPLSIGEVYARASAILGIPLPQLKEQLYINYTDIYGR